jgi:hypothetical protein
MSKYLFLLIAFALVSVVFSGCTSQEPTSVLTIVPTPTDTPTPTILPLITNAAADTQLEKCGNRVFNPTNQTCCNNNVYEGKNWQLAEKDMKCVNISSSDSAICDGRVYDTIKEGCCNGRRIFSKKSQGCCGEVVYDLVSNGHNMSCCGGHTPYSESAGTSCVRVIPRSYYPNS